MKTKFIYIVLGILFFASATGFAQEKYTDAEIGFNVPRITKKLDKRGYNEKDIADISVQKSTL